MDNTTYLPDTELRNPASTRIDEVSVEEMLGIINSEDQKVAQAVQKEIPFIARAVEAAEKTIRQGGRVIYCGCGTSGRLGVLDASECPPTYSVPSDWFMGIIAGGYGALVKSSEGAEDSEELCVKDLKELLLSERDMLVGIAASGRTPYVIGGLNYARQIGAQTACIVCSKGSPMAAASDIVIAVDAGPEVVTGSTRMKAGTAQKLVLNMLSTGTMIRLGKTYGNLMVDLSPSNSKLVARAQRIIRDVTGCAPEQAEAALLEAKLDVKAAILMISGSMELPEARVKLAESGGLIKRALKGAEQK